MGALAAGAGVNGGHRAHPGAPGAGWQDALASPIFSTLAPLLSRCLRERFPTIEDLNALRGASVSSGGGAPIRFVGPGAAPRQSAAQYEERIFLSGEVQTRPENWHDLFNAFAWLAFPATKAAINRHHHEQIAARKGDPVRGTARDVLTLFDEGGIVVASGDRTLSRMLREFQWKPMFWDRRGDVARCMRFFVFGHAIHETALQPHKGMTAKALIVEVAGDFMRRTPEQQLAGMDAQAAAYFSDPGSLSSTRLLGPLPILGIPGWEPANAREDYYDDVVQFRPGRTK